MAYGRNTPLISNSADLITTNRQNGYVIAYDANTNMHKYVPVGVDLTVNERLEALENAYVRSTRFATITSTTGTITPASGATIILDDFGGELDCDIQKIKSGRPSGEAAFDTNGLVLVGTLDASGNYTLSGTPADPSVALVYRVRQKFKDYDDTASDILGDPFKEMPEYKRINLTAADSPYSPVSVKNTIFAVNLNSGDVTINLPEITPVIEGDSCHIYIEATTGSNKLTVNTFGTQTIRGKTSQVFSVLRDGFYIVAHTYSSPHWDALNWARTDEIVYNPGNAGVSTIKNLQQLLNYNLSSGQISGCVIASPGDGTVQVTSGEWKLRTDDTPTSDCRVYAVPAASGLVPLNNTTSYLVINYNDGNPSWSIEASLPEISNRSKCVQAVLYRTNNQVNWMYLGYFSTDFYAMYAKAQEMTSWLQYGDGLMPSALPSRRIATTAGILFQGILKYNIPAFNTSTGSVMSFWYRSGGGWAVINNQTQFSTTQFDNGSGSLVSTTSGRFLNWWLFVLVTDQISLVAVYPQVQHNSLANARAEAVPVNLPPWASKFSVGKLIAKVTVRQGVDDIIEIGSPFVTQFSTGTPVNHNDLSNIQGGVAGEYYHLSSAQHAIATTPASTTNPGYVTTTDQSFEGRKTFTSIVSPEINRNSPTVIQNDLSNYALISLDHYGDQPGGSPFFRLKRGRGTIDNQQSPATNDTLGEIACCALNNASISRLKWTYTDNPANGLGTSFSISTTPNGSSTETLHTTFSNNSDLILSSFSSPLSSGRGLVVAREDKAEIRCSSHANNSTAFTGFVAGGTSSSPSATTSGASVDFSMAGFNGSAYTPERAKISLSTTQNWDSSAQGTKISFSTTSNNSSSIQPRMHIDHNGDVLVGPIGAAPHLPGRGVYVYKDGNSEIHCIGNNASIRGCSFSGSLSSISPTLINTGLAISFYGYTTSGFTAQSAAILLHASQNWTPTAQGSYISFGTTPDNSTTRLERMRIQSNGEVTINEFTRLGSTAPAVKLKVVTGTSPGGAGLLVFIPHGLDHTKILSFDVLLWATANVAYPPESTYSTTQYSVLLDGPDFIIKTHPTNSSSTIFSKTVKILVTYTV